MAKATGPPLPDAGLGRWRCLEGELVSSRPNEDETYLRQHTRGNHDSTPHGEDEGNDGGPVIGAKLSDQDRAGVCAKGYSGERDSQRSDNDGDGDPGPRLVESGV